MRVPLLNFAEGPGILLLNFEGGPGFPLLNFGEIPGPKFKLRGGPGSRIPGTRGPGSWGPGPSFTPCHILCHATNAKGQFFFKILKDYRKR